MSKQSVINVKITADNEIEYVDVDYSNEDEDSGSDSEIMQNRLIIEEEIEPELIPTGTDSMMIKMKNVEETIVEHVCGKCNEGFYSIDELKRHLNLCRNLPKDIIDTKENIDIEIKFAELENFTPQQCFCCLEELTSAHNGHIKCNFCPKSFKSHINLERHLFTLHSSNSAYACAYCNVTCPTQKMYDLHIATHVNGKPFACHKCGKDFTRKYHLDRHRLYTKCDSSQPKSQLPCKVCGKVFSRIDNLREHLRGHIGQGTRRRDYQCPYCEKSFYGSSLLNIHIRTHTGEKPFPCDLCTKTFPSNGALRKHRRMHTGEKPYSCKECAKCFSAKETLNRHMKIHTGDRPHICEYCNKKFIQATQLRAHLFHHTGEHGFHCSICGQMFNRKTRLESHIKMVHINSAKYTCDICNAQFRRKTDLVKHCDKHNKTIKKYLNCNACEKYFSTKAALQVHLRSHEINEELQCQICKRTFKKNEVLLRHMKNKHKDAYNEKETQEIVGNYIISDIKNEHFDDINIEHMVIPKTEDSLGNNYDILGTYEVTPSIDNKINNNTNNNNINDNYNNNNNINENNNNDNNNNINNNNYDKKKIYNNDNNNNADNSNNGNNINIITNNNNNNINNNSNKNKNKYKTVKKKKIIKANVEEETPFLSDARLKDSIGKLLNLLVDESTLKNFGWPKTPVEEVLSRVIKQCGQMPADYNNSQDHTRKMRENAKLLFTTVIENDAIKAMLNNNTVDEVIMHVLKLADKK